jgi:rSAM/selenodomain-associated transferase 2
LRASNIAETYISTKVFHSLPVWRYISLKVSIIVPTLNEELVLKQALTQIQLLSPHELIVSDGGSTDNNNPIAQNFSHHVVTGSTGRAIQMNAGVDQATGDLLLFLHADNRLEPESYQKMLECMENPKWIGGAFTLSIESDKWSINLITLLANIRSKYFGLAYGDQGFFVRTEVFKNMNGFSPIPICEDLDFYRRLKKKGPVNLLKEKVHTSPRRWIKEGIAFTTARNILIALLFGLGFPPRTLTKWYLAIR